MSGGDDNRTLADLPLGAAVLITGIVIGDTRFRDRRKTYLVQFNRKGRPYEDWFFADDLEIEEQDGGGI